jgi:hypothetical protein
MKQMAGVLKLRFQIHAATEINARDLDCLRLGLTDKTTNFLDLGAPLRSHRRTANLLRLSNVLDFVRDSHKT